MLTISFLLNLPVRHDIPRILFSSALNLLRLVNQLVRTSRHNPQRYNHLPDALILR
jgi:hypothetical protein